MPSRNRFLLPLPFKQFLSAVLLRIFPIQNLEPRTLLSLRDIRPELLLGNDALQIQFTNTLKQCSRTTVNVLGIFQRSISRRPCQQSPKFLFPIQQSLSSQILPVTNQQIECEKARRVSTVKHQIFELWSATSIERINFSVNDRSHIRQGVGD